MKKLMILVIMTGTFSLFAGGLTLKEGKESQTIRGLTEAKKKAYEGSFFTAVAHVRDVTVKDDKYTIIFVIPGGTLISLPVSKNKALSVDKNNRVHIRGTIASFGGKAMLLKSGSFRKSPKKVVKARTKTSNEEKVPKGGKVTTSW